MFQTKYFLQYFLLGYSTASIINYLIRIINKRKYFIDNSTGDDFCNSLFYDVEQGNVEEGNGFPVSKVINKETIKRLKVVHDEFKKLPFDFYSQVVENLPVVCVDVICRRKSDGKILLFYRKDKPAAKIWWWPGGRQFKGETFFDTAIRKIKDETGNKNANIRPISVLNVWNTFFPDSNWDHGRRDGREGTQTVNVVVVVELLDDDDLELQSAALKDWAVSNRKWIHPYEALRYKDYDKYVFINVRKCIELNLLKNNLFSSLAVKYSNIFLK
jgi:ADP-ribose pyrophosphatase YjhB (NUDIX family)